MLSVWGHQFAGSELISAECIDWLETIWPAPATIIDMDLVRRILGPAQVRAGGRRSASIGASVAGESDSEQVASGRGDGQLISRPPATRASHFARTKRGHFLCLLPSALIFRRPATLIELWRRVPAESFIVCRPPESPPPDCGRPASWPL